MREWIAYVGPFAFPWGQPGSRRVYGVARSLLECGYDVVVGSGRYLPGKSLLVDVPSGSGIYFEGSGEVPDEHASKFSKIKLALLDQGKATVSWLEKQPTKPKCIITYGGLSPFMYRVQRWANAQSIPVIADVVEWYDGAHMIGGRFGPFHLSSELAMRWYFPRCQGVIAISSFLEKYFSGSCVTTRVPPLVESVRHDFGTNNSKRGLRVIYAGTPGKKDLLGVVMRGLCRVTTDPEKIVLQIIGPSQKDVENNFAGKLPANIEVVGRVPQQNVSERLASADFSVLLRVPERFAQAGFSTKFVESMAVGTPVIANLTSDLGSYLRDGENGIVCAGFTEESFSVAIERLLAMDYATISSMRNAAANTARDFFCSHAYVEQLREFINKVCAK